MKAGFAKADITPAIGTPLLGWGIPSERPCTSINDPIFVRALWLEHEGEAALILSFDWCFVGREDGDRFKGVLGRTVGLSPERILLNATHSHSGPAVGDYQALEFAQPERDYLREAEAAMVKAANQASGSCREVTIRASAGKTSIPMSRRCKRDGGVSNAPNPDGEIYETLPVCLFEDHNGNPVCLLFAASTHVVCMRGEAVSADYPGVAVDLLDAHLGETCAMFLQGMGGDSRPALLGEGREDWQWDCGWKEAQQVGETLVEEVIDTLSTLKPVEPALTCALLETHWTLEPHPSREEYLSIPESTSPTGKPNSKYLWAQQQARLLERDTILTAAPIFMQGIQLGPNLRIIALEGETMAAQGHQIEHAFNVGGQVTFALGYSNGEGLYLATTQMLEEGGYEAVSFWEYGFPSSLAKGTEKVIEQGLEDLKALGIV